MKQYHPTLDSIRFCPQCGAPVRTQPRENYLECFQCGFVLFFNAALAVAVILRDSSGRILLTRRAKAPAKGKLDVPGGFADIFEKPEAAACRELEEECGIVLRPENLTYFYSDVNPYSYRGVTYVSTDLYFSAQVPGFSSARALDESSGIAVLHPREIDLEEISFDSARNALKCYMAANDIKQHYTIK